MSRIHKTALLSIELLLDLSGTVEYGAEGEGGPEVNDARIESITILGAENSTIPRSLHPLVAKLLLDTQGQILLDAIIDGEPT